MKVDSVSLALNVLLLLVVGIFSGGAALAQLPNGIQAELAGLPVSAPSKALPVLPLADVSLVLDDDGAAEHKLGLNQGNNAVQFMWLNQFDRDAWPYLELEEIWVLFPPDPNFVAGSAIQLAVYLDEDKDPTNGAVLLDTLDTTIQVTDGTTFSVYLPSPIRIEEPGDILIGVVNRFVNSGVSSPSSPAALDTSSDQGRSWISLWSGDPPSLPGLPGDLAFMPASVLESGNFLIRGFGRDLQNDLAVQLFDGQGSAVPGESVTYTLWSANSGPGADPEVMIRTQLSSGLSCDWTSVAHGGASDNVFAATGELVDTISLPVASNVTYTGECLINSSLTGVLSSTATIMTSGVELDATNNTSTDETTLTPIADLFVELHGDETAVAGESLHLTLVVVNNGPSDEPAAALTEIFPADLTCSWNANAANGASGQTATGSGNLGENLVLPAGGSVTYDIQCQVDEGYRGSLVNVAQAFGTALDPVPSNVGEHEVTILGLADLALEMVGPEVAVLREAVTYSLRVINHGPQDVVGASIVPAWPDTVIAPELEVFDVAVGSPYEVDVTVDLLADATEELLSQASVVVPPASFFDPDLINDAAETTVPLAPASDLSVQQGAFVTVGNREDELFEVVAGKRMSYRIEVRNGGPSDARNVLLNSSFPLDELTVVCLLDPLTGEPCPNDVTVGGDFIAGDLNSGDPSLVSKTVERQWVFDLAVGEQRTYEVEGKVDEDAEGVLVAISLVEAADDPSALDNQTVVNTTVVSAELIAEGDPQTVSVGRRPDVTFSFPEEAEVIFEREVGGSVRIVSQVLEAATAAPIGDEVEEVDGDGIHPAIAFDADTDLESSGSVVTKDAVTKESVANGGAILKVWQKIDTDPNRIVGRWQTQVADVPLLFAKKPTPQLRPAVTARGDRWGFLTVWESGRGEGQERPGRATNKSGILGRFVNPLGQVLRELRINSALEPDPMRPDVAAYPGGYLVVWDVPRTLGSTKRRIVAQWLDVDGKPVGPEKTLTAPLRDSRDPTVAYNARHDRFLVVWQDREENPEFGRLAMRLAFSDRSLGATTLFGLADRERSPDVSTGAELDHFTVTWDRRLFGTELRPYLQVVTADGEPNGSPNPVDVRLPVADPLKAIGRVIEKAEEDDEDEDSSHPSVAFLPGGDAGKQVFFVSWSEAVDDTREVRTQRYALTADLVVSVTDAPDPIPETGGLLTYTITVDNLGPTESQSVVLQHLIPAGVTPLRLEGCRNDDTGSLESCDLGTMLEGESRQYTLEVDVPAANEGRLDFVATAGSPTPDPFVPDNTGRQLTAFGNADLSIGIESGEETAVAGATFTWLLTVHNAGPSAAGGVRVVGDLTAGVDLVASTDCEAVDGRFSCDVGELARSEERRLALEVELASSLVGDLSQSVRLLALTGDNMLSDNQASAQVPIAVPDLKVTLDAPTTAFPDSALRYVVTVTNSGDQAAAGVTLELQALPEEITLSRVEGCPSTPDELPASCFLGEMGPGAGAQIVVEALIGGNASGTLRYAVSLISMAEDQPLNANAVTEVVPSTVLPLLGGRFEVTIQWNDGTSVQEARARPHSDNTGFFYFFQDNNIEVLVKMLDGGRINEHFWLFHGGLTDLEYTLFVRDTATGEERAYFKAAGDLCGGSDLEAFDGADGTRAIPTIAEAATKNVCGDSLCLLGERFRISLDWAAGVESGVGQPVAGTDNTGYFWFFNENNLEMAVKVLDGTAINGSYWVFAGGLTDVETTLTVTETETGAVRQYRRPAGDPCGLADTAAFSP